MRVVTLSTIRAPFYLLLEKKLHDVDLSAYKLPNKRQVLRNCVHRDTGLALLLAAELEYEKRGAE